MNTTQETGKGVLVLHPDGAAAWWSPLAPAVAGVRVAIGSGAVVEVDAGNPSLVVGWGLQAGGDLPALAAAFDDPRLVEGLRLLAETGQEVFTKAAPTLTEAWVRRATVAAVAQCTLRPVHEGALLLDQATADYEAGRGELAASLFRAAAPSLLELGEDCLAGQITGGAATNITHIADVAVQSLGDSGWGPDVLELAEQLKDHAELSDALIDSWLAEFERTLSSDRELAGHLGLGDDAPAQVMEFFLDPLVVPPRLLAWPGGTTKDITVAIDTASGRAEVSAELAQPADDRNLDAQDLMAYAADPRGTVVAIAPMRVDGHRVTATVICEGHDATQLHYGVYHTDTDPGALRFDPVGQLLVEVDRRMLDVYENHRLALAKVYGVTATGDVSAVEERRDEHLQNARSLAAGAIRKIADFLKRNKGFEDARTLLQRREEAISLYRSTLEDALTPLPGTEPLLTELLPPDIERRDSTA